MTDELARALATVTERLLRLADSDEELRDGLRDLAHAILVRTAESEAPPDTTLTSNAALTSNATVTSNTADTTDVAPPDSTDADAPPAAEHPPASTNGRPRNDSPSPPPPRPKYTGPPVSELISKLTLGQQSSEPESDLSEQWHTHRHPVDDADLPLIERRCRLKAEGSRWAARRRRLIAEGADFAIDVAPIDREIIARAKELPDCFLWMNHPSGPSPADPREYDRLANCFENVAEALAVLHQIISNSNLFQNEFEQGLDLLAEAQSALRVAIAQMDGPHNDTDQFAVFNWLKATAAGHQIFIQRHMRMNDPADPDDWSDLANRIDALATSVQEAERQSRLRNKLLGKVRHKLTLIAEDPEAADEQWRRLAATVDELISNGLPASNRELRDLLLPAIDDLPDIGELPPGFQQVLTEIDRFMATGSSFEPATSAPNAPEVDEVARLLRGRSVVLIGGQRRPASQQALKEAFQLQQLIWVETREHESVSGFEPYVAQPDVAVVLLAIRWSSHSYGQVREFCEKYGKPLVRLPGGYSPNQVAMQIMQQCSDRLQEDA